uniref:hypothetical protein n=1 Tax=Actinokineospora sp. CA-119265 TaxID=3239890 RepID=UPI003F491894
MVLDTVTTVTAAADTVVLARGPATPGGTLYGWWLIYLRPALEAALIALPLAITHLGDDQPL